MGHIAELVQTLGIIKGLFPGLIIGYGLGRLHAFLNGREKK